MIDITNESLIPVLDVLQFVPISVATMRRWVSSGKLEVVRAGRRIFTSREAIQRLLQQGPPPAHAPALRPTRQEQGRAEHLAQVDADLRVLLGEAD